MNPFAVAGFLAVAPLAGARVETFLVSTTPLALLSRPSRARGLKLLRR